MFEYPDDCRWRKKAKLPLNLPLSMGEHLGKYYCKFLLERVGRSWPINKGKESCRRLRKINLKCLEEEERNQVKVRTISQMFIRSDKAKSKMLCQWC